MNLKSQTRYAQTVRFFNVSFRLNLKQFFPNDSLVYDVFGLFQCTISKTGNLLLFQCIISNLVNLLYLTTLQATLSSTPHSHQHPHSTRTHIHTLSTPTPQQHPLPRTRLVLTTHTHSHAILTPLPTNGARYGIIISWFETRPYTKAIVCGRFIFY